MDGRSLLSYFDADDDYYPIAVMTPNGLRVIEISNDDDGKVGVRWNSTDPESYEFTFSGSSVVLLEPSESLLRNDPPRLISPILKLLPEEGESFYDVVIAVINTSGPLSGAESSLPFHYIFWEQ